ncbi:hypothetical protein [Vibrio phage CKB-S2]|nr:hypothetical protein [Vibrio phage CKB-S2]
MDKITWLALAAELEIELMVLRAKVLNRCLTQSQVMEESNELHYCAIRLREERRTSYGEGLAAELTESIEQLEKEMGLHLYCPY